MKRNILIMLVFVLLFSTVSVGAMELSKNDTLTEKEIEEILLKKGVSLDIQQEMSEGMKRDVALDDDIIELVSTSDEVSTKSAPSGLDVRSYSYTISDINGYDAFKLYTDFIWDDCTPLIHLTDKIGIAWNNDDLSIYNSYLYYEAEDELGVSSTYSKVVPDDTEFYGRGYSVPISVLYNFNKSGYMWVKVYDTKTHGTEELKMIGSYYHKNVGFDSNLTFSTDPSVGIGVSIGYDDPVSDPASINYSTN
jgi:hypothetical protein